MKNKRSIAIRLVSILLVVIGAGVLMYPAIADYMSTKEQEKAMSEHEAARTHKTDEDIEKERELTRKYNDNLIGKPVHDPFEKNQGFVVTGEYGKRLNLAENGVMGTLEIPKIKVNLPIYHGCSEEVLRDGVGHIEGTALPIGGKSTHSMLSAHRGLPEATLFTHLDKLKKGDEFYIHVLDEVLAYKVYKTEVIEPEELSRFRPVEDKDLVTLITCTPYGKNTQRLLVHGQRTKYNPNLESAKGSSLINIDIRYLLFGIAVGLLIFYVISRFIKKRF